MYKREHNFYGGQGIVGAQVPVGAGLGFAHKYRGEPRRRERETEFLFFFQAFFFFSLFLFSLSPFFRSLLSPPPPSLSPSPSSSIKKTGDGGVAYALYGDGAANQGQIAEAFNIAALWQLPVIFVCENNHYGMGTAEWRGSKSSSFYTRGDYMPGLLIDGMDVLAVKNGEEKERRSFFLSLSLSLFSSGFFPRAETFFPTSKLKLTPRKKKKKKKKKTQTGVAFAKEHALKNGPIVLEMDTYRYHGHSMSDPGSTYRTRDEVAGIRQQRDPVEGVRRMLLEKAGAEPAELKKIEKAVKAEVDAAVEQAKKDPAPPPEWLSKNVWVDPLGATARGVEAGTQYKL